VRYFDIAVIGGGASGLMAALRYKNKNIAVLESTQSIANKIKISGGGRCNITNKKVSADNYLGERVFIQKVLDKFSQKDLIEFLKKRGLNPIIRKKSQYFCPKSSDELIMIFKKELKNVPFLLGHSLCDLKKEDDDFLIFTNKGTLKAHKVVIATGGISYQKIGATDIAFEIAKKFSHNIITPKPALVGFTVQKNEFWFKELSGISIKVRMKTGKKSFLDDLLFAHRGISAPAVLNSSLYWDKGSIEIDFLPDISLKSILKNQNRQISSLLPLPKRFTKAFLQSIDLEDKRASLLTKEDKEKLSLLKSYTFSPAGTFGYSKAEVTKGGIDTDEIDPDSMMSRYQKNLFFIGECLNVTGELGGYNLQWAFSSAFGLRI